MSEIRQMTHRPTVVFAAENLETGDEALILTTAIPVRGRTAVLDLAMLWEDEHDPDRYAETRRTR